MKAVFLIFSLVEWLRKKMKEVLHLSIVGSVSLNTYREVGCAKKEKKKGGLLLNIWTSNVLLVEDLLDFLLKIVYMDIPLETDL